jgi:hypothetical protein
MLLDATRVRREIARLFDAKPVQRIVLAPGILSALRHLFSVVEVEHLALTTDEYYASRHFPSIKVSTASPSALVAHLTRTEPDAVLVSVVSWHGKPLPVSDIFAEIRAQFGQHAPLLVADYTHAGAVGFPPVRALNADIVCGDPEKWLLPPEQSSKLAFLWIRSPKLFRTARRAFAPLFLSVEAQGDRRSARWVDPLEVRAMAHWLSAARLTRLTLLDRYQANLRTKQKLARMLGVDADGAASVLWTQARIPTSIRRRLERAGLIWRADAGYTRVLCRAEALDPH